jgi:hypothetical protein
MRPALADPTGNGHGGAIRDQIDPEEAQLRGILRGLGHVSELMTTVLSPDPLNPEKPVARLADGWRR